MHDNHECTHFCSFPNLWSAIVNELVWLKQPVYFL